MESSRDTSNAASGDGVSKHYGFQTRPTVNLSSRDDKKSYGDYENTSGTATAKGRDAKDAKDPPKQTKEPSKDAAAKDQPKDAASKDAANKDQSKDQPKEPAKEQGKMGKN